MSGLDEDGKTSAPCAQCKRIERHRVISRPAHPLVTHLGICCRCGALNELPRPEHVADLLANRPIGQGRKDVMDELKKENPLKAAIRAVVRVELVPEIRGCVAQVLTELAEDIVKGGVAEPAPVRRASRKKGKTPKAAKSAGIPCNRTPGCPKPAGHFGPCPGSHHKKEPAAPSPN